MSDDASPPVGFVPLEWMDRIEDGMTAAQVVGLLGEPNEKMLPHEVKTPSQVFESLGSIFRPTNDDGVTQVWIYQNDTYPPVKGAYDELYCLGFAGDVLQSQWRIGRPRPRG